MGADSVEIATESGLPEEEVAQLSQCPQPDGTPIRFISMGRLLHWKGFHLGVSAFAQANLPDAEYWICGDGPEAASLQSLAQELGIGHQVRFWGRLPREQTLEKLAESHVLVHPSLHDSGGWVCLEAMAAGRPVICLNLGGPGVQVTKDTGFKIPPTQPEQAIAGLAKAMVELATNTELRLQMGQTGRALIQAQHSWQAKGEQLSQLYQQVTSHQL